MSHILVMPAHIRTEIIRHAAKCAPNEACGMFVGRISENIYTIQDVILTDNEASSPVRFIMPAQDVIRAYGMAEEQGADVVGVYHSHPSSPAIPSGTDATYMELNDGAWVIYSGLDGRMRAWIMRHGISEMLIQYKCAHGRESGTCAD